MHVGNYLALLRASERALAKGFAATAAHHSEDPDIATVSRRFARACEAHRARLAPLRSRYGNKPPHLSDAIEVVALRATLFRGGRSGLLGALRDVQDLWLLAHRTQLLALLLWQAGAALRDEELKSVCADLKEAADGQIAWLRTRVKEEGAQILIAAPPAQGSPVHRVRAWAGVVGVC